MAKPEVAMNGVLSGEHFKRGVSIDFSDNKVLISYALWQVALPADWVVAHPVIGQFLRRDIGRSEALRHQEARPLVTLLDAQGCFTPHSKQAYTLREVKEIFDPIRSQWYADYYAHPAWEHLRVGRASVNMLVTWLIHNYHISRAAGVAAARMCCASREPGWRKFFCQDALSEYWHCDAFYSLKSAHLANISFQQIKDYVPLSSSLAFEEHTLQVAEHDPLGHLLIAYFQESSIAFNNDSLEFYQAVEDNYGVAGLFTPWQQHIQIDVDQGHADGLGKLLDSDREVAATELQAALRHAWLAFRFLYCGLDDIELADASGQLSLRPPLQVPHEVVDLYGLLQAHLQSAPQAVELAPDDVASLLASLAKSAFAALGRARAHDEIIACGRWAQCLAQVQEPGCQAIATVWSAAVDNHLQEAAHRPLDWLLLTRLLSARIAQLSLGHTWTAALDGLLGAHRPSKRAATALFQLDELIERCGRCHDYVPDDLLFASP
jgi:hypothetical protein